MCKHTSNEFNVVNIDIKKELFYIEDLPYDLTKVEYKNGTLKYIILLIPGNPGLVDFYESFIKFLLINLNPSYAVWCVSHACFSQKECLTVVRPDVLLAREVEHKVRFIQKRLPHDVEVILVGHSIGCHMILSALDILTGNKSMTFNSNTKLMEERRNENIELYKKIKMCYLLFPTIERMKSSPSGQRLLPVLNYLQTLCKFLAGIINILPHSVKKLIASLFLPSSCDAETTDAIISLLTAKHVGNMLKLAENELNTVVDLDTNMVNSFSSKLLVYYGKTDNWCPLFYRNELLAKVPNLNNIIDDNNISHAFVISKSEKMASILADLIKNNKTLHIM